MESILTEIESRHHQKKVVRMCFIVFLHRCHHYFCYSSLTFSLIHDPSINKTVLQLSRLGNMPVAQGHSAITAATGERTSDARFHYSRACQIPKENPVSQNRFSRNLSLTFSSYRRFLTPLQQTAF